MASLGPFSSALHIRPTSFLHDLGAADPGELKNGHLLEFLVHIRANRIAWTSVRDALMKADGRHGQDCTEMLPSSLQSVFNTVKTERRRLMKSAKGRSELDIYLNQPFKPPARLDRKRKVDMVEEASVAALDKPPKKASFDQLCDNIMQDVSKGLREDLARLQTVSYHQQREIATLKKENAKLKAENETLRRKVSVYCPSRVNQSLKRKADSLRKLKNLCNSAEKKKFQKKLNEQDHMLKRMKKAQKRTHTRHIGKRALWKQQLPADHFISQLVETQQEMESVKMHLMDLESQQPETDTGVVETLLDGKTFHPKVREASYKLQNCGVPESKVSKVIQTVMHTIVEKDIGPLPSVSTQRMLGAEMLALSRQQVKEAVRAESHTTLKYDGTTKKGTHLTELEVGTKAGTYLLGIRQQAAATAKDYAETIQEISQAIDSTVIPEVTAVPAGNHGLLSSVSNTMTDRCATNKAVDAHLSEMAGRPLNSFRCSQHPLVTFSTECEKEIRNYEKALTELPTSSRLYTHGTESQTHALIRKAGDLFHNDQTGVYELLTHHLKELHPEATKGQNHLYERYVGNRLNIVFTNAQSLYFYKDGIISFFRSYPPTNDLQRAVLSTLKCGGLHVSLQALGLVCAHITAPWIRLCANEEMNILDLNPHLCEMAAHLRQWIINPGEAIAEKQSVFSAHPVKEDHLYQQLTSSIGAATVNLFGKLCAQILNVVERQMSDQLPGGTFWQPSPQVVEEAQSCNINNISGERVFGRVDSIVKRAPNMRPGKIESRTLFATNKTADWLAGQSSADRDARVQLAQKEAGSIRQEHKMQAKRHVDRLREKIKQRREHKEAREVKKRDNIEQHVDEVLRDGLWSDAREVDQKLAGLSATKSKTSLKRQITVQRMLGRVSATGRSLAVTKATVQELSDHLKDLLGSPVSPEKLLCHDLLNSPRSFIGKDIRHVWADEDDDCTYLGTVTGMQEDYFSIQFEGDSDTIFMTQYEVITDALNGELTLV